MAATAALARAIHALLLALWAGAGLLYLAVVIPEATRLLPGPEARALLGIVLSDLDLYGIVAGPLITLTLFLGWSTVGARVRVRTFGALLMITATVVSGQWLTPRIVQLERGLGRPLEQVPVDDPIRASIEQLLVASDALTVVVVVLALLMLIGATRAPTPKRPSGILI